MARRRPVPAPVPAPAPVEGERPDDATRAAAGVGDIFATAFNRYGGGFLTFGLLALLHAVPLAVLLAIADATDGGGGGVSVGLTAAATLTYLLYAGNVTALLGGRLRASLPAVASAAALSTPALTLAIVVLGPVYVAVPAPFLFPFFLLAPVAAGVEACRRSFRLVSRQGYLRSAACVAALEIVGVGVFLAFRVVLGPIGGTVQSAVAGTLWVAVFWPLSALVLRNLYGALDGRLVVRT
jgi:hypothetical protein